MLAGARGRAMARYPYAGHTYEVAARFVDVALRRDDSLFTPGRAIWTMPLLDEIHRRFVEHEDGRTDVGFEDKLRSQLSDASPDVYQAMAELLYLYYFPARWTIVGATKRARIGEILRWSPSPVSIPADLDAALDDGVASGGAAYHNRKPAIIRQLLAYVQAWKGLDQAQRDLAFADPWLFEAFVDSVPSAKGAAYARESFLHVVHPDTFERIFSRSEKWRLLEAVTEIAPSVGDNDRRLWGLRQHLTPRLGDDFDWYDTIPARALWRPFDDPWTGYLYWGGRFRAWAEFDRAERDYKLRIAERMGEARVALREGASDWVARLKRAYGSPNNITNFHAHGAFLRWVEADPERARPLLAALWDGDGSVLDRFAGLLEQVPADAIAGHGTRVNVLSLLLLAIDPHGLPAYKASQLQRSYELTNTPFDVTTSEIGTYRRSLDHYDAIIERGKAMGLELRDRLDAQGVLWCIVTSPAGDDWPPEERVAFERWRGSVPPPEPPGPTGEEEDDGDTMPIALEPTDPIPPLAARLLLADEHLREIAHLLDHKRQVVFYGPPGTGKTYVARELAWALAGSKERVRLVQFHPSYAYEDFVEGYRPRRDGGSGFELRDGPFKALAAAADADRAHDHYLIIDELNRGNVAKVLGELYFLLEYRDEEIALQYSAIPFRLPPNLRIIATMNTADRSIALLDAALRRRFSFIPFFPDRAPVEGLLRRWLRQNRPDMAWVADVVDLANERLADRNGAIGPSFFLKADLDDARLARIWRHEIEPYLEDHLLDEPERLREFDLGVLRAAAGGSVSSTLEQPVVPTPEPSDDSQA